MSDYLMTIPIALALAMDSFAVSICGGAGLRERNFAPAVKAGLYFGAFQALMPVLGWCAGVRLSGLVSSFDHWLAFGLLFIIGGKMLYDFFRDGPVNCFSFDFRTMVVLAIATSIDAMGIGLSYAFLDRPIYPAFLLIGSVAFVFSFFGVRLGLLLKNVLENRAQAVGGIILLAIGIKILIDHGVF